MSIDFNRAFSSIKQAAIETADDLKVRNQNNAKANKIRRELKAQEAIAAREYITLGRYYYSTLRDKNAVAVEPHCITLDAVNAKLDSLIKNLDDHYEEVANLKAEKAAERREKRAAAYLGDREDIDIEDVDVYADRPLIELKSKEELIEDVKNLKVRVGDNMEKAYISGKEAVMKAKEKAVEKSGELAGEFDKKKEDLSRMAGEKIQAAKDIIKNIGKEADTGEEIDAESVSDASVDSPAANPNENDNLPFE